MAPVAEDDGLCWWCCGCGDDETCPHPVARCPECLIDEYPEGWDEWFAGDDEDE